MRNARREHGVPDPTALLLSITFLWLVGTGTAQARALSLKLTQYSHTAWRVQEGVFNGTPSSIAQTTDGYLWIGTNSGLIRFDGVRFVDWKNPATKSPWTVLIRSLLGAKDGSLWIGTGAAAARLNVRLHE